MRISDWSSDVCSSDLFRAAGLDGSLYQGFRAEGRPDPQQTSPRMGAGDGGRPDRKSVVLGKSVSVRVDLGGRRVIKKKITMIVNTNSASSHAHKHYSQQNDITI